jgi:hypothetical protein
MISIYAHDCVGDVMEGTVKNGEIEDGEVVEKPDVEEVGRDKYRENHKEFIDESEQYTACILIIVMICVE